MPGASRRWCTASPATPPPRAGRSAPWRSPPPYRRSWRGYWPAGGTRPERLTRMIAQPEGPDADACPAPEQAPRGLPSRAVVDLGAIRDNVAALAARAGSAEVMAVVKADGYGHGLLPSARAAVRGGATWLGVAQLGEAMQLRAAGLTVPVLSWLHVPGSDFAAAIAADVDLSVSALWAPDEGAAGARAPRPTPPLHPQGDTRLGPQR